jgi:hypothetical protein
VDKARNSAITAIRNIKQESFVAATLDQIGWKLIHRATSSENLLLALQENPEALLITSEEFRVERGTFSNAILILDSKKVLEEYELQELLRRVDDVEVPKAMTIATCTSDVTVVTTLDSGIGGSTFAMNYAYESARSGRRTLLLDLNPAAPLFARYFSLQGINRNFAMTKFGFSVGEVSEYSFLSQATQEANDFERVVIDLGKVPSSEHLISGVRIHEAIARWGLQSANNLFILARSEESSIRRLELLAAQSLQRSVIIKPSVLLTSQSSISGREGRLIREKAEALFGREVHRLPRDPRGVARALDEGAPLAIVAPKSPLVQVISSLYQERK